MYFITIKRMLEVCFSAHPNIQYRAYIIFLIFLFFFLLLLLLTYSFYPINRHHAGIVIIEISVVSTTVFAANGASLS